MTPQRAKSCTCEAPHLQLEDETRVVYCHRCGRQVRPRAEASVLEAIRRASTEAVAGLDQRLASFAPPPAYEPPAPRLTLSKGEAASALGVSVDFLEEHVLPDLNVVRRGRRVLIAVAELRRWLDQSAERTLA